MAKKRSYPANLMHAIKFNQFMESDIDYEALTDDQIKGLSVMMKRHLTEREYQIMQMFYVQGISKGKIAVEYEIPENRVRQIIEKGLRKLRKKDWLLYVIDGYENHIEILSEQLKTEESKYCAHVGITDTEHLYYQNVDALGVSRRVLWSIKKGGCETIRDVIISLGTSPANRKYGEVASIRICDDLIEKHLLPENYEPIKWQLSTPTLDIAVAVFKHINSFFPD